MSSHGVDVHLSQLKRCVDNFIMVAVLQAYFGDGTRKYRFGRSLGQDLSKILGLNPRSKFYGLKYNSVCTSHGY